MGGGADHALQRLLRRGMHGRLSGVDALRERLRRQREREESLLNLGGPLEIRERLEEILERGAPSSASVTTTTPACARPSWTRCHPTRRDRCRSCGSTGSSMRPPSSLFDELQEHVREQVMSSYFRQMAEGMRAMTPEDIARFKDMLAELNGLIEMRERGRMRGGLRRIHGNDTATCSPTIRRPSTSCSKHGPSHGGDERADGVARRNSARSSRGWPSR